MIFPAGQQAVRSRFAPRGVVSLPVPWKFSPVRGFWNSVSFSIWRMASLPTRIVFMV